jgi:hypothetical protein
MTLQSFIAASMKIAKYRDTIRAILARDAAALARASLRPFLLFLQQHPDATIEEFTAIFERDFHLTRVQMDELARHLRTGQATIGRMREMLYREVGAIAQDIDATALQSAFRVDFPRIDVDVRRTVLGKIRKLVAEGGDIATFEAELRQSQIVSHQARTLSQTALAQFDNTYTITLAREAGIDEFKYIGPPAMRPFCQALLAAGKTYTLAEIEAMNNGQGLDVFSSGGGYNCQHQWIAVPDSVIS